MLHAGLLINPQPHDATATTMTQLSYFKIYVTQEQLLLMYYNYVQRGYTKEEKIQL
jgi:hypothetical protein